MGTRVRFLFDMDGTVTAAETLPLVAAHYGIMGDVEALTGMAVAGDIPYEESLRRRVALLAGLPVDEVSRVVASAPLHEHIARFIIKHHDQCAIVSSNLDCWCHALVGALGCPAYFSRARVDGNRVGGVEWILRKQDVVDAYKAQGETVVFVGDGHNDLEAMSHAHVAIAVGLLPGAPAASLVAAAHHVFTNEKALCRMLESMCAAAS